MTDLIAGFMMVIAPDVLIAILASAVYGLVVGSLPGLSATMATALLVPITFYLSPIAAVATIITASAMAIFSGDIPGCLLRIPGTPASAAYVEDSSKMTQRGEPELALGIGLWFSVLGGLFGTAVMMAAAPAIADFALGFGSVEFFWIVMLGLGGAVFIGSSTPLKACIALLLGLLIANRIAGPISRLITAAERVRAGDLSTRVQEGEADDEVAGAVDRVSPDAAEHRRQRIGRQQRRAGARG